MKIKEYFAMQNADYSNEIKEILDFLRNLDIDDYIVYSNDPNIVACIDLMHTNLQMSKTAKDIVIKYYDDKYLKARDSLLKEYGIYVGPGNGPNNCRFIIYKSALKYL